MVGVLGLTVLGAKWPLSAEVLLSLTLSSRIRRSNALGVVVGLLCLAVIGAKRLPATEVLISLA